MVLGAVVFFFLPCSRGGYGGVQRVASADGEERQRESSPVLVDESGGGGVQQGSRVFFVSGARGTGRGERRGEGDGRVRI